MINFKNITLKQIADELILRVRRFKNTENLDWLTVVKIINRSIREILVRTLPYKQWAYIDTINVSNGTVLPVDTLSVVRVLVSEAGTPPYKEARKIDAKEWYAITDWHRQQEWNKRSTLNPVYVLWGYEVTPNIAAQNDSQMTIYIAPNTDYQTGTAPSWAEYYTGSDYSGIMEMYRMPADLVNDTDTVAIPAEFQDLIVLAALARWMSKAGDPNIMLNTQALLLEERMRVHELYAEKVHGEEQQLDSFVEPVPPIYNPPPPAGEMPARLR